jgi:hypothetical protein
MGKGEGTSGVRPLWASGPIQTLRPVSEGAGWVRSSLTEFRRSPPCRALRPRRLTTDPAGRTVSAPAQGIPSIHGFGPP